MHTRDRISGNMATAGGPGGGVVLKGSAVHLSAVGSRRVAAFVLVAVTLSAFVCRSQAGEQTLPGKRPWTLSTLTGRPMAALWPDGSGRVVAASLCRPITTVENTRAIINAFPQLETLRLSPSEKCPFDQTMASAVAELPSLRRLVLSDANSPDFVADWDAIGQLTRLREVVLWSAEFPLSRVRELAGKDQLGNIEAITWAGSTDSPDREMLAELGKISWARTLGVRLPASTQPKVLEQVARDAALCAAAGGRTVALVIEGNGLPRP